ncbi:MAG: amino acid permease, partial [Acidobacteria bacterium]|nr:amino acid permease [Acidobacteriota bacterium]
GISILCFFLGNPLTETPRDMEYITRTVANPDPFFYVFAICFPAFTGMTAGVGLSGDLKRPKKSIPLGTLSATLCGMVIYLLLAFKLGYCAEPDALAGDQLIMSRISVWGPIIPIGLACATFSSAVGSIMVAPRTLQAIGSDELLSPGVNRWLSAGRGASSEPFNASVVACLIALVFVAAGDVNSVAEIISMFFMLTYGSICLISFLEHFAADPSYRPTFNSRWYISLLGALACFWLMFKMNGLYAFFSLVIMVGIYLLISFTNPEKAGMAAIFQGVIFQLSRKLQIFLQNAQHGPGELNWRPSVVCISENTFKRTSAMEILRWMSHHYGFGTYIHFHRGYLSKATKAEADALMERLIRLARAGHSRVFVDTMVSPSETSAISQVIQLPGVSGHENNGLLLEFSKVHPEDLDTVVSNAPLIVANQLDLYVLGSSERKFGYHREIHIWITRQDEENANLMILLGYILLGDPEWSHGMVKIFATYPESRLGEEESRLRKQIRAGRLPISQHNIRMIAQTEQTDIRDLVNHHSQDADLVILGFRYELLKHVGKELFLGFDEVGDILFVRASGQKMLATEKEMGELTQTLGEEELGRALDEGKPT